AALVGLGAPAFSPPSGRRALRLAAAAVLAALAAAGLRPPAVAGLPPFPLAPPPALAVARAAGLGALPFFSPLPS
ncbi:lipid-transfer protein, partial [Mycobacterium tuberculosis]